jgi:monofunctional biosynthetic peptidoglycan transglycosylase
MVASRTWGRISEGKRPYFPRRQVIDLDQMSPPLIRAVLAAEDDAFYLHHGFDLRQIERALLHEGRGRRRGASTISQQTAKNLFLWSGRSYLRKGLEAYLTFWLELLLSKDRLLEIYLNLVECGDGAFGVEACARRHFKKPAAALGEEEAARLAAILPNPRRWSPFGDYATGRVPEIRARMAIPIAMP